VSPNNEQKERKDKRKIEKQECESRLVEWMHEKMDGWMDG